MPTSQGTPSTLDGSHDEKIPVADLIYERERLRNRIHDLVLGHFTHEAAVSGITRAKLARKLGKRPEQITRWLSSPGNWTTDTISDLMFAMGLDPASVLADPTDNKENHYSNELKSDTMESAPPTRDPAVSILDRNEKPSGVISGSFHGHFRDVRSNVMLIDQRRRGAAAFTEKRAETWNLYQ